MKVRILFQAMAAVTLMASGAFAQCSGGSLGGGVNGDMTMSNCVQTRSGYPRPYQTLTYAARDHFSPHPLYAYSRNGIEATREDQWNTNQAQSNAWHGDYSYWRWGAPTALVVPPTAAFQSEYNWGVAQTRSMPIYHQFGSNNAGLIGSGAGEYPPTPYWPRSTNQFGIYPVRGPWH